MDYATITAIALAAYNIGKWGFTTYKRATAKKEELSELLDGLKHVVHLAKGGQQ